MPIHPIYVDFLEKVLAARIGRPGRYRREYYLPNRRLLDNYHRNWSGRDPGWVEARLDDLYPDGAMAQLAAHYPPSRFPAEAAGLLEACMRLMPPPAEPDVYLMVGVYTSNAFETVIDGRPAMGLCLEQHNPGPAPKPWALDVAPRLLPRA